MLKGVSVAEPTTTGAALVAASAVTVPTLTVLGTSLGLRPDVLIAGFCGALAWITLLKTMPTSDDTWRELVRTSLRRMSVACASALTSGYLTPVVGGLITFEPLMLGLAFVVGAGAQRFLVALVNRQLRRINDDKPDHGGARD